MKIDGYGGGSSRVDKTKTKTKEKKVGVHNSSVQGAPLQDQIEVNDHESTLAAIRDLVNVSPDVRSEEVDRIVDQLKNGKYKINFEKVADGFIKEAILNEMSKRSLER
jgi:flagellar biosynthesis anti-sigma factor FlgM